MHKLFCSLLLCVAANCWLTAESYAQKVELNVEKAAKVFHLHLDSLAKGRNPGIYQINRDGEKLSVRINISGKVDHIGFQLFSSVIRVLQPSPIYDYLEFAVLDHKYHISENPLQLQQLKFRVGDWTTLEHVTDSMLCQVNNVEDKYYEVTWRKDEQVVVSVSFPINYELLANSNRKAILEQFVSSLRMYSSDAKPMIKIDSTAIKPYGKGDVYVLQGDSYIIPAINTNTYFRETKDEKGGYEWLKDKQYPGETLANRLLSPCSFPGDALMKVTCYLYNYRKEIIQTTVANWMAFCKENGCMPYYGFESDNRGLLTATLIMRNRESGYDHVLDVTCQREQLEDDNLHIDAVAYLYTPSSNVGSLFYEPSKPSQNNKFLRR